MNGWMDGWKDKIICKSLINLEQWFKYFVPELIADEKNSQSWQKIP